LAISCAVLVLALAAAGTFYFLRLRNVSLPGTSSRPAGAASGSLAIVNAAPTSSPLPVSQPSPSSLPASSTPAAQASFNCALASAWAEQQVCASADLAAFDREVTRLYRRQLAATIANDRGQLIRDQRAWIVRRNACTPESGISCVYQAYQDRIAELGTRRQPASPVAVPPTYAAPTPAQPRIIRHPDWISRPGQNELVQSYPPDAQRTGLDGRAVIQCIIASNGTLTGCAVSQEDPPGSGFGDSALRLAPLFVMKQVSLDGQLVAGGIVRLAITFRHTGRRTPFYFGAPTTFGR
jgi:uncharacterized protein